MPFYETRPQNSHRGIVWQWEVHMLLEIFHERLLVLFSTKKRDLGVPDHNHAVTGHKCLCLFEQLLLDTTEGLVHDAAVVLHLFFVCAEHLLHLVDVYHRRRHGFRNLEHHVDEKADRLSGILGVRVAGTDVEEVGSDRVGERVREQRLPAARGAEEEHGLGVGHLLVQFSGGHGQDGVLAHYLTHLRQRRVRENARLLQRGSKIVEASQEVLQLAVGRDGLDDVVADQRCVQVLHAASLRRVLLALALLALLPLALLALPLLALLAFFALLARLGRPLRRHHVLEVGEQHAHLVVHVGAHLLKHHRPQRLLHQLGVVFLEKVGGLVAVLPDVDVLLHRALDALDEVARAHLRFHLRRLVALLALLALVILLALVVLALLAFGVLGLLGRRVLDHGRVEDDLGAAVLLLGEVRVLPRVRVAVLHEPRVDAVLDGLAHVLPLHLPHLRLERDERLVVLRRVLALHNLAPPQALGHLGLRVGVGVARGRLHADEDELRLGDGLGALPGDEPARRRLHARRRLLLGHRRPPAHLGNLLLKRLLPPDLAHDAAALAPLPPPLVHLDDANRLLLGQGRHRGQRRLRRALHPVLLHQRVQELGSVVQLLLAVLHVEAGHGDLQDVRGELEVHQDVVQLHHVVQVVQLHHPRLDLQDAPDATLQRLLDVQPLLRVHHLVVALLKLAVYLKILDVDTRVLR
mmetsp:Transcript_27520/g.52379  ORF Transcript_27520/g.52379 Transcript_27520/m.52379 type:complete len:693 (-) Transcript_27520:442-2520(-)